MEVNPDLTATLAIASQNFQEGKLQITETICLQILESYPEQCDALYLLGLVAAQQGHFSWATSLMESVLQFQPTNLLCLEAIARLYEIQGDLNQAIQCYELIIKMATSAQSPSSQLISLLTQYTYALYKNRQFDLALQAANRAYELGEKSLHFLKTLVSLYSQTGYTDLAIELLDQIEHLYPNDLWIQFSKALTLPLLYISEDQIEKIRTSFRRGISLLEDRIKKDDLFIHRSEELIEVLAFRNNFYLSYQGRNDCELNRLYADLVANLNPLQSILPEPSTSFRDKVRIGFISCFFSRHSVSRTFGNWINQLDRDEFEVYGYYLKDKEDETSLHFRDACDQFYSLSNDFSQDIKAFCKQIMVDTLDVLVYLEIGMGEWTNLLSTLRLATHQCATWGHPVTSGSRAIDYYLAAELLEPDNAEEHYSERIVRLPHLGVYYQPIDTPMPESSRLDFGLNPKKVVFLSAHSLFKYLPQFDHVFAAIAKSIPDSQFVFIQHELSQNISRQFQERMQLAFERQGLNFDDYGVFLPRQNYRDYLNLAMISDVFLDCLEWSGFNTILEMISCEIPIVTLAGSLLRGRFGFGILSRIGVTQTIAQTPEEYIAIAIRLGLDPSLRQDIKHQLSTSKHLAFKDLDAVRGLESFLKQVSHRNGYG